MHSHPIHVMSRAHAMLMSLHEVYILHAYKGTNGILKNYALYQASWATTSIACNSYPYIIRIHISNTHISVCYSSSNQHAIGFFSLNIRKIAYTPHFPTHIFQQHNLFSSICSSNITYFSAHIFQQHNLFSSSYFPAQKKKKNRHIPKSFSQQKLHVIQTKKLTSKLDFFFPVF